MDSAGTIEAALLSPGAVSESASGRYHAVEDKELDRFIKLERPVAFTVAALFSGIFFGTVYQALSAFLTVENGAGAAGVDDLLYVVACAGSFGVAMVGAVISARGKSEVMKTLEAIRERPRLPLPIEPPAPAPAEPEY